MPENSDKLWTSSEEKLLILGFAYNLSIPLLSQKLLKSQSEIVNKLCELNQLREENGNLYSLQLYGIIENGEVIQCD